MKTIFKFLPVLFLTLFFFSCKEGEVSKIEGVNKHSSARTNAPDWHATQNGTSTVPAGTYNYIYMKNGATVNLSHGVTVVRFNWDYYSASGTPATINIPVGATVTTTDAGDHSLGSFAIFNNRGTFNTSGRFQLYGTFNNYGVHNANNLNHSTYGYYKNNLNSTLNVSGTFWKLADSTPFELFGCSKVNINNLTTLYASGVHAVFTGRGNVKITGTAQVYRCKLTDYAYTKICATNPIQYFDGGSFGVGVVSCMGGCTY